jgi:hypothetical protein
LITCHQIDPFFHFPRFATDSCHEEARQAGHLFVLDKSEDSHLTLALGAG